MKHFFDILNFRNGPLFIFGCCNMLAAFVFLLFTRFSTISVTGVNAWVKPFKFALSIAVFAWTMGWYTYELHAPGSVSLYNQIVIIFLGFEVVYIAWQAGRGQLSHYNTSSPVYSFMTFMMAFAAIIATLWTGYIGILFFTTDLTPVPYYYVLSIRMGILLFVIFAFQGALMGPRQAHTVGGPDGGPGIPMVNWSTRYGDLRIAHFIGMHALQVLPLASWYIFKNTLATALMGCLYALLAAFTLIQALQGKALMSTVRRPEMVGEGTNQ